MEDKVNTKIISLEASNIKRIKAIRIEPDGNMIVIGGDNGAGKSSILDSIEYALNGGKSIPSKPLRNGEDEGYVVIETESLVISRKFTPAGSKLVVTDKENGMILSSPQGILDRLTGELTFDPLRFSNMSDTNQNATLTKLVGIDFTKMNADQKSKKENRKFIKKEVDSINARLSGMEHFDGIPKDPVNVSELMESLSSNNDAISEHRSNLDECEALAESYTSTMDEISEFEERILTLRKQSEEMMSEGAKIKAINDAFVMPDNSEIENQINNAHETNTKIQQNNEISRLMTEMDEKTKEHSVIDAEIKNIDKEKAMIIHDAPMPVDGLGLSDDGVVFNNIPFDQCSSAEQLRISIAMGVALNPQLKILLIRDGSLLDNQSLRMVAQMANESGMQVWMERVSTGSETSVVIEDGEIKS